MYSVSHDLRAPLVNLQGFSQELALTGEALKTLLENPAVPPHIQKEGLTLITGEMAESLEYIRKAVRHLGNIIDGLLRLSRVGRIEYQLAPVDVGAVVNDILSSMHTMVLASGAQIELDRLPVIRGDRNAICRCLRTSSATRSGASIRGSRDWCRLRRPPTIRPSFR